MIRPGLIRPGRDADGGGYIALIAGCWGEYPGVNVDVAAEIPDIHTLATSIAGQGGALWTAEDAGQIVGMVATYPAGEGWQLSRMYVSAAQRGTGLGRGLLAQAEDHARGAGAKRMVLWSDMLFTRAHAFYEKHGYVRRGGLRALHDLSNTIEAGYAKPLAGRVVEELDVAAAESAERPLASLSQACVQAGAPAPSVPPFGHEKAHAYWRSVTREVGRAEVRLFAAWRQGTLAGTVQLGLRMPEGGQHRAELRMLMVAPGSRCRGLARGLMLAAEEAARQSGRRLLVLHRPTDEHANQLYHDMGWSMAGTIPGFALDGRGAAYDAAMFYKAL